jgi:hypothetical protein
MRGGEGPMGRIILLAAGTVTRPVEPRGLPEAAS